MFSTAAERMDIDGEAAFRFGSGAIAITGGDAAVDGDVADFFAVEFLRENHGAGLAGNALDDAFFLKRTEVAHRSGLAGETEVVLKLSSARHQAGGAAGFMEIFEDFLLSGGKLMGHGYFEQCSSEQTLTEKWLLVKDFFCGFYGPRESTRACWMGATGVTRSKGKITQPRRSG